MKHSRRKEVEEFVLKYIGKITNNNEQNLQLYKDLFKRMNNDQFDKFMNRLKNNEIHFSVIVPPGNSVDINVKNNLKIAPELGVEFYQRLKHSPRGDIPGFTSNEERLIIKLPIKRASQILTKKISVQENSLNRDTLTGQVTGNSRACKLTYPEIQILSGYGLKDVLIELLKSRGGDQGEGNAMDAMLLKLGRADQQTLRRYSTGVRSTKTLKSFLLSMHIRSTL